MRKFKEVPMANVIKIFITGITAVTTGLDNLTTLAVEHARTTKAIASLGAASIAGSVMSTED